MQPVQREAVPVVPDLGHRPPGRSLPVAVVPRVAAASLRRVAAVAVPPAAAVRGAASVVAGAVTGLFAAAPPAASAAAVAALARAPTSGNRPAVAAVTTGPGAPRAWTPVVAVRGRRTPAGRADEPPAGSGERRAHLLRHRGVHTRAGRRGVACQPVDRGAQGRHPRAGDEHDVGVRGGRRRREVPHPQLALGRQPRRRPAGHLHQQDVRAGRRGPQERGAQVHRRAPSRQA